VNPIVSGDAAPSLQLGQSRGGLPSFPSSRSFASDAFGSPDEARSANEAIRVAEQSLFHYHIKYVFWRFKPCVSTQLFNKCMIV
jgi:hypothetical protein